MNNYRNAKDLKTEIEKFVREQDDAVTAISYAVTLQLRRIEKKCNLKKDNILVIGPTGCGKTETYRALKAIETSLRIPIYTFGALTYSPTAAWQGTCIDNFLNKCVAATKKELRKLTRLKSTAS